MSGSRRVATFPLSSLRIAARPCGTVELCPDGIFIFHTAAGRNAAQSTLSKREKKKKKKKRTKYILISFSLFYNDDKCLP